MFWTAALAAKGGSAHRAAGHRFARAVYGAAATGALLAIAGLLRPSWMAVDAGAAADTRHLMWLTLYLLVVIVAPVQHGIGVIAAGSVPARVRSYPHLVLNTAAIAGTVALFPAVIVWQTLRFLLVVPAGFIIGVRNMQYANRAVSSSREWEREHLTSQLTAGIAIHTTFLVMSVLRWPSLAGGGWWSLVPWVAPAFVGLPVIWRLRKRR